MTMLLLKIIEGKRMRFNGSAVGLFGHWIKWWFFSVITFGIYGFWVFIKLEDWKAKHTTFCKLMEKVYENRLFSYQLRYDRIDNPIYR